VISYNESPSYSSVLRSSLKRTLFGEMKNNQGLLIITVFFRAFGIVATIYSGRLTQPVLKSPHSVNSDFFFRELTSICDTVLRTFCHNPTFSVVATQKRLTTHLDIHIIGNRYKFLSLARDTNLYR
jgi:hypothetical protein